MCVFRISFTQTIFAKVAQLEGGTGTTSYHVVLKFKMAVDQESCEEPEH
jgi:hypothetical protein